MVSFSHPAFDSRKTGLFAAFLLVLSVSTVPLHATTWQAVAPSEPPVCNPLKGFVPYSEEYSTFPYSLEYEPIPIKAVQTGYNTFNWNALEEVLDTISGRGHQALIQFYYDSPDDPSGIPSFLSHVPVRHYTDYENGTHATSVSPDYEHADLKTSMFNFIAAFGSRYDGDPRIGFIELGLLGFWGEWHTYPWEGEEEGFPDWMPTITTQNQVLAAYDNAFDTTRLLVREPRGNSPDHDFGYHDDSFVYYTYDDVPPEVEWYFQPRMVAAGESEKWKSCPMGGELRPELQGSLFETDGCSYADPEGGGTQTWNRSVELNHASWIMVDEAFYPGYSESEKTRALEASRILGYALRIDSWASEEVLESGKNRFTVKIQNIGVAPFYYKWDLELGLFQSNTLCQTLTTDWDIRTVIDGTLITFAHEANLDGLGSGDYTLAIRLKNPLQNGDPVIFANSNLNPPAPDWQVLGTYHKPDSNSAPVLTGIENRSIPVGQALQFQISANDADGDTPTFSASGTNR